MGKEFLPQDAEVEAPKENHLGLLVSNGGETIAIPPGAVLMWIIKDEQPLPYVLLDVRKDKLVFKCACGKKTCNRKYIWKMTHSAGSHNG